MLYLHGIFRVKEYMTTFKEIIISEGFTQAQIAEACGMTTATINRYANGKNVPTLRTANKIVNALNQISILGKTYMIKDVFPNIANNN